MFRRCLVALCAASICALSLVPTSAGAQPLGQADEPASSPASPTYADDELAALLHATGLTGEWLAATDVSAAAALVEVVGGAAYVESRAAFLSELTQLDERQELVEERLADIDRLESNTGELEELIRTLRRSLATSGSAAASLTNDEVEAMQIELAAVAVTRQWMGISFDPLWLAEHHLASVRDDIENIVDGLGRAAGQQTKSSEVGVSQLTELHGDLELVRVLIARSEQASIRSQLEVVSHRATVVGLMPDLHTQRLLRPSTVGGLPVVTLDAYVQGAAALDPSCPVEWNLIAGIGRVESRHGTIGDATVQASGRVTNPILGPLLDGGATKREAAAAAAAALAEAEAEEEVEPEEPPEPEFDAALWGIVAEPVEVENEDEGEDEPKPRYDPLLWGDDLPFDEDDPAPIEESGDVSDEGDEPEEPEFRGNGFAVILDSDNGKLDGNSRWDRAVGPMQFIPETWSHWATDGNGDGSTDPQNLYDAAASAGQFLCHLSRTRGSSPYSFVLGYNSSQTYVRNVMAVADAFAAVSLPTGATD